MFRHAIVELEQRNCMCEINVCCLEKCCDRSVWPLTIDQVEVITTNCLVLSSELDLSRGLLSELVSAGCINTEQMRLVEGCIGRTERNGKLIDFISRRSQRHLQQFVDCLRRAGQQRLATLFARTGGTELVAR